MPSYVLAVAWGADLTSPSSVLAYAGRLAAQYELATWGCRRRRRLLANVEDGSSTKMCDNVILKEAMIVNPPDVLCLVPDFCKTSGIQPRLFRGALFWRES